MAAALCRFTAVCTCLIFLSKVIMVTVVLPAIGDLEPNNLLIFNLDKFGFHFILTHAHTQFFPLIWEQSENVSSQWSLAIPVSFRWHMCTAAVRCCSLHSLSDMLFLGEILAGGKFSGEEVVTNSALAWAHFVDALVHVDRSHTFVVSWWTRASSTLKLLSHPFNTKLNPSCYDLPLSIRYWSGFDVKLRESCSFSLDWRGSLGLSFVCQWNVKHTAWVSRKWQWSISAVEPCPWL